MTALTAGPAVIRCRDGDHTLALADREVTAERLIRASRRRSFSPDTDVDWDAPPVPACTTGRRRRARCTRPRCGTTCPRTSRPS
jgi:hypothetical protein